MKQKEFIQAIDIASRLMLAVSLFLLIVMVAVQFFRFVR